MALTKITDNLDIIAALPDIPSSPQYSAQTLKAKFDEGAEKIKNFINSTLIPEIEDEFTDTVLGDGAYHYIPCRKLVGSFTSAGTHTFTADETKSFTGVYDIVCIGGGGAGSTSGTADLSGGTGGGAGEVKTETGISLSGVYTVTVGGGGVYSAGAAGTSGGTSSVFDSENAYITSASGGGGSSQISKIGFGGGPGGGDSVYGDGTVSYGHGGDNAYGRGTRGAIIADSCGASSGYGAGGWGTFNGKPGAVLIYGYIRTNV